MKRKSLFMGVTNLVHFIFVHLSLYSFLLLFIEKYCAADNATTKIRDLLKDKVRIEFNDGQLQAIDNAIQQRYSIIHGPPGLKFVKFRIHSYNIYKCTIDIAIHIRIALSCAYTTYYNTKSFTGCGKQTCDLMQYVFIVSVFHFCEGLYTRYYTFQI